jgi:hypothetical protein
MAVGEVKMFVVKEAAVVTLGRKIENSRNHTRKARLWATRVDGSDCSRCETRRGLTCRGKSEYEHCSSEAFVGSPESSNSTLDARPAGASMAPRDLETRNEAVGLADGRSREELGVVKVHRMDDFLGS